LTERSTGISETDETVIRQDLTQIGYLGESRSRSLIKALTWRLEAILVTVVGFGIATGDWTLSAEVGIAVNLIKMALYYLHERLWDRLSWGRIMARRQ